MNTIERSPSCPQTALEMQPVLTEMVRRKGSNHLSTRERNLLAMLRDEIKRRNNLPLNAKLPDDLFGEAEKAVELFLTNLHRKMFEDDFQLETFKGRVSRIKFDDLGRVKETRFQSVLKTGRETRDNEEAFAVLLDAKQKLAKRVANMREAVGKYTPEEIGAVEAKLESVTMNYNAIMAPKAKTEKETK